MWERVYDLRFKQRAVVQAVASLAEFRRQLREAAEVGRDGAAEAGVDGRADICAGEREEPQSSVEVTETAVGSQGKPQSWWRGIVSKGVRAAKGSESKRNLTSSKVVVTI